MFLLQVSQCIEMWTSLNIELKCFVIPRDSNDSLFEATRYYKTKSEAYGVLLLEILSNVLLCLMFR